MPYFKHIEYLSMQGKPFLPLSRDAIELTYGDSQRNFKEWQKWPEEFKIGDRLDMFIAPANFKLSESDAYTLFNLWHNLNGLCGAPRILTPIKSYKDGIIARARLSEPVFAGDFINGFGFVTRAKVKNDAKSATFIADIDGQNTILLPSYNNIPEKSSALAAILESNRELKNTCDSLISATDAVKSAVQTLLNSLSAIQSTAPGAPVNAAGVLPLVTPSIANATQAIASAQAKITLYNSKVSQQDIKRW